MAHELRRHIEEIIKLSDDQFSQISSYFSMCKYKKGEFLFKQGTKVSHTYFVISGLLKLINVDESGKEHILSFAMDDWWETDYLAFTTNTEARMSLQCLEDSTILCIDLNNYNNLCLAYPIMVNFFLVKATSGHIASQQRILSLLSSNTKERYERLLKRYPSLFQRVPKTLLASYLGVSRETLSRLTTN